VPKGAVPVAFSEPLSLERSRVNDMALGRFDGVDAED
jgi:hypothetical protein